MEIFKQRKKKLERDRATEEREPEKRERDWEDRDVEKREIAWEKRELTERLRGARMRVRMLCLECFTENLVVKQLDVK